MRHSVKIMLGLFVAVIAAARAEGGALGRLERAAASAQAGAAAPTPEEASGGAAESFCEDSAAQAVAVSDWGITTAVDGLPIGAQLPFSERAQRIDRLSYNGLQTAANGALAVALAPPAAAVNGAKWGWKKGCGLAGIPGGVLGSLLLAAAGLVVGAVLCAVGFLWSLCAGAAKLAG